MSDPDFSRTSIIGIPWCRQEDYDAFVAIFEDREDLPESWQLFAKSAEEAEEFYKTKGNRTVRIYIDPRTFPEWCRRKGRRVNTNARVWFAHEIANAKSGDD